MTPFKHIKQRACERQGGWEIIDSKLIRANSLQIIKQASDDRWLSAMTKCVFQAGFNWTLIENKWPRFEAVFDHFNLNRMSDLSDHDINELLKEEGIVRNYLKIKSVRDNALFLQNIVKEYQEVGHFFATWKIADYVENLIELQKYSSRLGGKTGQHFLRQMSVDTLVFSPGVIKSLTQEGVVNGTLPKSKKSWMALQQALDYWHQDSGYSLNEISQILAYSVE
jgi:3-methyladenine DNA glycosylase Tag